MIDDATIECWRANYGLDKNSPADAMRWWNDQNNGMAPAGAVAALGLCLEELAALRADAMRYRWLRRRNELNEGDDPRGPFVIQILNDETGVIDHMTGAQIDAAIDAMQAAP